VAATGKPLLDQELAEEASKLTKQGLVECVLFDASGVNLLLGG